jgi:AAA+ superfamily predicted ATPase
VLCTGAPGLGKTLTAEIYSEVAQRPLYTVQASQLGVEPEQLEDNLLKCFARADRWKAILLLDEADVYIHPRGDDLHQNAIVGVFLRTLEYYRGVMFMTTNRPDLVDDAIASRCIARIDYALPTAEAQQRIWQIQAEQNGATISPKMLQRIVAQNPACSGRDIKNLVKLALLVGEAKGQRDITDDMIKFVKRFKPTVGADAR